MIYKVGIVNMTMVDPVRVAAPAESEEDRAEEVLRYNIRKYLSALGISQNTMAKALGWTSGGFSQTMTGRTQFKYKQVIAIAKYLGVTLDDLADDTYYRQDEELIKRIRESDAAFVAMIKERGLNKDGATSSEEVVSSNDADNKKGTGAASRPRFLIMPEMVPSVGHGLSVPLVGLEPTLRRF